MQAFVDIMLRRSAEVKSDTDVVDLLGYLAEHLGYRSGYLLDFPNDPDAPIRLWDSNPARAAWWRDFTGNGVHSVSKSFAKTLDARVHHLDLPPDDPRYEFAVQHDFASATVVPVTFDSEARGIASFSGTSTNLEQIALSLQIVCYALLMQARTLGAPLNLPAVALTPREREVITLSAEGMTSDMVATTLGMSPRTASQHMDNVAIKLRTKNRVHTVAEALRRRLLN